MILSQYLFLYELCLDVLQKLQNLLIFTHKILSSSLV